MDGHAGRDGHNGVPGPAGEKGAKEESGGAVYVRWGNASCPTGQGTELLYSGRGAGSRSDHTGGGANHLCMPNDPDYMRYESGVQEQNYLYGMEYGSNNTQPLQSANESNVPCAVCYVTTRDTVVMIPAKVVCPTN